MIILINGTISSGKSTIAKLIGEKIPRTAIIEIDNLRSFIERIPLEEAIPINLENTVSIITNFVNRGFNVVIPYPLSQKNYDFLMDKLKDLKIKIFTFTLNPKPEELLKSKRGRNLDDWEKKRIKYHTKIGLNKPIFGKIINNTNQTSNETLQIMLDSIREDTSIK